MKMDKKEEKQRYEPPIVLRLDEVDKVSGAGIPCTQGSLPSSCTQGINSTLTCGAGGAGQPPA
jgi:hypothetical protein